MSISRLWVDKYIPKKPDDIIGNKQNIKWMTKWLNHFMKKEKFPNFKNGLLISGDPGIGKTSAAHALLKHFGFDIVEFNASEVRSQKVVREKLKSLVYGSNIRS